MMNEVIVREAVAKDNAPIRDMIFSVLEEYDIPAEPDGDDLDAMEFGLTNTRVYIVAEISGEPIGSAILTPYDDNSFKLSKLFLPKKFRGKGIGRALLDGAIDVARTHNANEVFLRTRDSYKEAISLYDRAGWSRICNNMSPPGPPVKYAYDLK